MSSTAEQRKAAAKAAKAAAAKAAAAAEKKRKGSRQPRGSSSRNGARRVEKPAFVSNTLLALRDIDLGDYMPPDLPSRWVDPGLKNAAIAAAAGAAAAGVAAACVRAYRRDQRQTRQVRVEPQGQLPVPATHPQQPAAVAPLRPSRSPRQ